MAYGYSNNGNGPSASPYSLHSQHQASEHLSAPNGSGVNSSRFNSRTVVEAPYYQCHLTGHQQRFDTFQALLSNTKLWSNFKNNIKVFYPEFNTSLDDQTIIEKIITGDGELRQYYFFINNIDKVDSDSVSQSEITEPTNHPVTERRNELTSPGLNRYNDDKADYSERVSTFTNIRFREYINSLNFNRCFREHKNAHNLSQEGFYFSFIENKVQCFSCGGTIQLELIRHSNNPRQLHGKFYPKCNFLRDKHGQAFINQCQESLTSFEENLVGQPLPDTPHLYQQPLSEDLRHRDNMELQSMMNEIAIREGRVPGVDRYEALGTTRRLRAAGTERINSYTSTVFNASIDNLRGKISIGQLEALQKLNRKIQEIRFGRRDIQQSFEQILQTLVAYPERLLSKIAAEITAMINAAEERDCQDHTSEIIDQIKTLMLFVALKQELGSEAEPFSLSRLLCKLKLFFNESVLYDTMAKVCFNNGTPLIASRESTEVRGYVKNQLAQTVCKFPENHIPQRYGTVGRLPNNVMTRFNRQFLESINNEADFINYLTKLFKSESQLLDLIKQRDQNFPVWCSKTDSNAELLMETLESDLAGATEQELLEGASNIAQTRERWLEEDIDRFFSEAVHRDWDNIISTTSISM